MEPIRLIVPQWAENQRMDVFIADMCSDFSRSMVQKIAQDQQITINGRIAAKKCLLKENDIIEIVPLPPKELSIEPENIPVDIVYEDDDLLVVNKPKGMVVHPAPGNESGTLVNALLYHCAGRLSSIGGVIRPGIVHRIDKNTSGLLMVAKTDKAHQNLSAQIKDHTFKRVYHTVVYGGVKEDCFTIDAPIGRSRKDRKKMAVVPDGRPAVTEVNVLDRFDQFTYLSCQLYTGRTHQIRVHLASNGMPIAGDDIYGPKKVIHKLQGQCLHAKILGFVHPISGEYMEFETELPKYFTDFLSTLKKGGVQQ